jgi:hypothetical protein
MITEYWIEQRDHMGDWKPIDKAYSHREAKELYQSHLARIRGDLGGDGDVRALKVTWEVVSFS